MFSSFLKICKSAKNSDLLFWYSYRTSLVKTDMESILKLLLTALGVLVLAHVLPGIGIGNYITAVLVALTISVLNMFVRPLLVFFTLPATIVTFGLFLFVINTCIILLTEKIIGEFQVAGFWYAMLFSVSLSIFRWFVFKFLENKEASK